MQRELEAPDVWNERDRAQALGQERARLENVVLSLDELTSGIDDAGELLVMATDEDDSDALDEIVTDLKAFEQRIAALEFQRMFSGELDANNAFVDIQSGAGDATNRTLTGRTDALHNDLGARQTECTRLLNNVFGNEIRRERRGLLRSPESK